MRSQEQLEESIDRFRNCFWEGKSSHHPPVGIYDDRLFLPINFLKRPFSQKLVFPENVTPDWVMSEYEYWFSKRDRDVSCDDHLAYSAPWRAIPWLEACCGCAVRHAKGSLAPTHFVKSADELESLPIPANEAWFDCLRLETERLERAAPPDCWISPSILRGPSDILAGMRGMTNFLTDLYDNPSAIRKAAGRVNGVLLRALDMHYSIVRPKLKGYSHIFGYWAPGKTIVIQEDAMGMASPSMYRDIFREYNAEVVRHLGPQVFFHLHSTGCKHYKEVMKIPGLAGLEITVESIGPTLAALLPVLQEILERTRLILMVDHGFEQLPEVLPKLPREGLYLTIPSARIGSSKEFKKFVSSAWRR